MEATVRRVGLLYETLGVLVVLVELIRAMSKHGVGWPHARLGTYLRDLPAVATPKHQVIHANAGGVVIAGGSTRLFVGSNPSAPLEQRVARLEALIEEHDVHVHRLSQQLQNEKKARAAADAEEACMRQQEAGRLHGALKALEVGSLKLSLFGLLWLLIGMLLTTGTEEVCEWLLRCV